MEGRKLNFKLPRLTAEVDCGPIDYPGLKVHFWLNVTYDNEWLTDEEWREMAAKHEEEEGEELEPRPAWERDYYHGLGRIIDRVEVPGDYTADGEDLEIPIRSGKALYELMTTPGFEQSIVNWASAQYYDLKSERLKAELKN